MEGERFNVKEKIGKTYGALALSESGKIKDAVILDIGPVTIDEVKKNYTENEYDVIPSEDRLLIIKK